MNYGVGFQYSLTQFLVVLTFNTIQSQRTLKEVLSALPPEGVE